LEIFSARDQLRIWLAPRLRASLAQEMEAEILQEIKNPHPITHQPNAKKKKQRKRKKNANRSAPTVFPQEKRAELSSERTEEDATATMTKYSFPTTEASPNERNKNIILVLALLENVVEQVFETVGLGPTPPFVPEPSATDKVKGKPKPGTTIQIQGFQKDHTQKPKPKKMLGPIASPKRHSHKQPQPPIESSSLSSSKATSYYYSSFHNNIPFGHNTDDKIIRAFGSVGGNQLFVGPRDPRMMNHQMAAHNLFPAPYGATTTTTELYHPMNNNGDGTDNFSFGSTTGVDDDEWPFVNRYQARERSILAEFFRSQAERIDDEEKLMAASTAASIASSINMDVSAIADTEDGEKTSNDELALSNGMDAIAEGDNKNAPGDIGVLIDTQDDHVVFVEEAPPHDHSSSRSVSNRSHSHGESASVSFVDHVIEEDDKEFDEDEEEDGRPPSAHQAPSSPTISIDALHCRSPSPEAPITPPPTLSPILVSLADLRDLKKSSSLTRENFQTLPERFAQPKKTRSYSAAVASGSLPSSPIPNQNGLTASWSREDLRIATFRDDQNIRHKRQAQPQRPLEPYKAAAVKSLAKPIASSKAANLDFRAHYLEASMRRAPPRESCAQSETAVEGHEDEPHWQPVPRKPAHEENDMVARDETTTITSALSQQREPEELSLIREERNSFRDMCLTLGAEVSKLKAMLAAQKASAVAPPLDYQDGYHPHQVYGQNSFDPNAMPPFFHGMQRGQRVGAMSDAGLHRGGDHESQVSEDEVHDAISKARADNVRRMSSSATILGSESSADFNSRSIAPQEGLVGVAPVYDAFSANVGLQSRLTKDILRFLNATSNQIKKQDGKKKMAIERFSRLVNTLWPRAQVKLYGSHVSGLCLPSSDLDFVVCLPAVHKNAPALAPGVLEGRNAINETSQKLLARALKGESWIDPRSIKLIERTVVPVIKVSTKDARARMIQLDISFDSKDHHGIEAIQMVAQVVDELPLIRPLVLVLKQFLLDRALLTSYTGGLSSYCLFLMVARYLQEQPSACGDCGSLLMGFLDFYGNCFDPRATGISVRRRQYFTRPMNYVPVRHQAAGQPMWSPSPHQQHVNPGPPVATAGPHEDFRRRNSFSDMGSVDGVRRTPPSSLSRPPRFQPTARFVPHSVPPANSNNEQANPYGHGRPFTFDPLFVEDPLSAGNNVGRNAFRVFQVQRAFSDAHRALVASLEWDIHSSGELNDVDYPLLKCLLQSEDVLYEL
jgi:DNA polymerase sigma